MAYYPKERNVNGVFYYGAAGSDQVFETNSNFTYDASTNEAQVTSTGITVGGITNQIQASTGNGSDLILIASGSFLRKLPLSTLSASLGGGTMNNWQLDGDTGPTQTVSDGQTVAVLGGTGLWVRASAGENVTVNISGVDGDLVLDGTVTNAKLENSSVTVTAGSGLAAGGAVSLGGSVTLNVGAGSLIDVQADVIDVDLTEAASATIADQDELIFLDGGTTESKGSTRDLATLMAGNGLTANNSSLDLTSSSITAAADAGSNQTIDLGNTLTIAGGSGITTVASATDTITVNAQLSTASGTLAGGALTAGVDVFMIDVAGGSESYTLPAVPPEGAMIRVKKIDSSVNTVTLSAAGGLNIDGGTNYILYNQYESVTLIAGSVGWFVF